MATFIDRVLAERRTLQQTLADIRAKYERDHDPDLARMVRYGEAEISERTSGASAVGGDCGSRNRVNRV